MILPLTAVCDDRRFLGVKLHPRQRELLEALEQTPNACWACGRRGGKTLCSSVVCLYDALFRPDLDAAVRPGEIRYSVIVATNAEQARVAIRSAKLIAEGSPVVRHWLRSQTADELVFDREGVVTVVRAMPCSSRGIRGLRDQLRGDGRGRALRDDRGGQRGGGERVSGVAPCYRTVWSRRPDACAFLADGSSGWFADHWAKADRGDLAGWGSARISTQEMNPAVGYNRMLWTALRRKAAYLPG